MKLTDVKELREDEHDTTRLVRQMRGTLYHRRRIRELIKQANSKANAAEALRLQDQLKLFDMRSRLRTGERGKGFDNPYLKDFGDEDRGKYIGDPDKYTGWSSHAVKQYLALKSILNKNGLNFEIAYVGNPQNFVIVGADGHFAWRRYLSSDGHYSNNDISINGKSQNTNTFLGLNAAVQYSLLAPLKGA